MTGRNESVVAHVVTDMVGCGIAGAFAALKAVRQPRPIHPRGNLFTGQVKWVNGRASKSGIRWIDSPPSSGRQDVTVRVSRSVGFTPPLPDVVGLAFRFSTEKGDADLLLASSWLGVPGRFLLRPSRSTTGTFASLMPYRGEFGAVEVAARTTRDREDRWAIELLHATSTSKWKRFAVVHLDAEPLPDRADLRFDSMLNPLPGAETYPWARRLRERSYAVARKE